ncbi:MAG TPA: hypothetical protein DCX32_04595 [Candidatus Moranbacteria bacterium]|nr:MAG: Ppic-type ppiase domain protein [Candidatus Moranbacteria bacterium GW2011_GWC2_45_10]KKT94958.1 MAG: parvulin-like protein peptidyl-prolyl isomerase, peptidyl-prolyl cis-trans isomerase SurA [Parcubacteria group bacterium GW2011_GWC1_45_14]HAV11787.1 hypothetical protein [Candidatus Moranbacteria bacterium]
MEKETDQIKTENPVTEKNFKIKTIASAAVVLIAALFLSLAGVIYFFSPEKDSFLGKVAENFFYPAAVVESTNLIHGSVIRENLAAIRKFYESQDFSKIGMRVDFSTEEGKKRLKLKEKEILNKAIEDKVIEILAKRRGITIAKEDVDEVVSKELERLGTKEEVDGNLEKMYGWNLEQFKERIVMPILYSQKLEAEVAGEISSDKKASELIEKAKKDLDEGKDFAEVARTYSQGASAQDGGDFGWIAKDQLLPEIAEKIFNAESVGKDKMEIIESQLGYHIVKVEENKKEDGVDMVRIRQIFARKMTFGDWLGEQMKNMSVSILLRDYYWDEQNAIVEFREEQMKIFERETYEGSEGDISVMF